VTLPSGQRAEWQIGQTTSAITEQDWAGRSDVIGALGQPVRLQILQEIVLGSASVGELTRIDGVGTSGQVYHHLRQLVAAGWLQSTSRGHYEVPAARLVPLLTTILAAQR
jgi:DNA-binding transcriptional ArsR family regulator